MAVCNNCCEKYISQFTVIAVKDIFCSLWLFAVTAVKNASHSLQ